MYKKLQKHIQRIDNGLNWVDAFCERKIIRTISSVLVLIISFACIFLLNLYQPIFGDDWRYSLMDDGQTRIQSFSDIYTSLYVHYFEWGGRIFVHIIDEILLLQNERTADLINSIAFVCFGGLIYKIANQGNTSRPALLLSIFLLIFFFQPAFASTVLWITGSANYLWGTLIIFSLLYFYSRQILNPQKRENTLKCIFVFFLGIIAGGCNENMAVGLLFMLIAFAIYFKYKDKHLPIWAITGLVGALFGAIFMIAAPGNYARMGAIASDSSGLNLYLKQFTTAIAGYYYYVLIPTFIYAISLILYVSNSNDKEKGSVFFLSTLYFLGAIVATLAMAASPIFPGRAAFGIISLVFLSATTLLANLDYTKLFVRRLIVTTLIFGLFVFVADYYRGYKTLREVYAHSLNRIETVENEKKKGITDIVLEDRIAPESRFLHYYELTPDSSDWHNRMYSGFHGINSIIVK